MKLVNLKSSASSEELLSLIMNPNFVNDKVKFDDKKGRPEFFVRNKKNLLKIKCQYTDGKVKDNGFLEGTYFIGWLISRGEASSLRGIVVTAPIYHSFLAIIMVLFVCQCISLKGFNPVPVILMLFSLFMFKGEFEKQGVIERYLHRAVKKADSINNEK